LDRRSHGGLATTESTGLKDPPLQLQADIADTDAKYQYRLTQIVLAYTISAPK